MDRQKERLDYNVLHFLHFGRGCPYSRWQSASGTGKEWPTPGGFRSSRGQNRFRGNDFIMRREIAIRINKHPCQIQLHLTFPRAIKNRLQRYGHLLRMRDAVRSCNCLQQHQIVLARAQCLQMGASLGVWAVLPQKLSGHSVPIIEVYKQTVQEWLRFQN